MEFNPSAIGGVEANFIKIENHLEISDVDMELNSSAIGGVEANLIKIENHIEIRDDALGVGKALTGIAKEIRKGGEGLLDRADQLYSLKHTLFPVLSAKKEAKALQIKMDAIEAASQQLFGENLSTAPEELRIPAQMMLTDYARKYININSTLQKALPMIAPEADSTKIDEDWLGSAFDYIGGVSNEELQELWARLLAQEANFPGKVSKKAFVKLSMLDKQSTKALKNVLDCMVSIYYPFKRNYSKKEDLFIFYKMGRFSFPFFSYLVQRGGMRPNNDFARFEFSGKHGKFSEYHDSSWLLEEKFIENIEPSFFVNNILHDEFFAEEEKYYRQIGIRFNYGPMYLSSVDNLKSMIPQYSNGGVFSKIYQLTDIAEDILDPQIYRKEGLNTYPSNDEKNFESVFSEIFALRKIDGRIDELFDFPRFLPQEM